MFNRKTIIFFLLSLVTLFGCLGSYFFVEDNSPKERASIIEKKLAGEIRSIDNEANHLISSQEESAWENISHPFFLMDSVTVVRWNQIGFLPDPDWMMQDDFEMRLLQYSRGSFLIKKWKLKGQLTLVFALPLQQKYPISNRYFSPSFNPQIFSGADVEILEASSPGGYPIAWRERTLFKIQFTSPEQHSARDVVTLMLGWMTLLLFVTGLFLLTRAYHHGRHYGLVFSSMLAGFVFVRTLMITFSFPRSFSSLFIFDPLQFASSSLNPSIADLLFNSVAVLVLAVYFFYTYYKWRWIRNIWKWNRIARYLLAIVSILLTYFSILFPFLFFETITHNSSISLDITQTINFDLIRILALFSILLGSVSGFLFSHAFFKMAVIFSNRSRLSFYIGLISASLLFFMYYSISERNYWITLFIGFIYFVLLYESGLTAKLRRFTFITFLYLFLAISTLAIQSCLSIKRFVEEKTREDQFRYGSNFLVDRDILGEFLLNEATQRISNDPFIQSRMATPFLAKSGVRQKINQLYLNTYFDRYDVQIYLYHANGKSHDNPAKEDFPELIKALQLEANKTTYDGIYFIESSAPKAAKQYLAIIPIDQPGSGRLRISSRGQAGFVVLDLSLKKLIPQNVFPELLVDNQFINYFKNSDFSFAFFNDKKLIGNSGNYNYDRNFDPELLGNSNLYINGLSVGGYTHIGMEDELGKVAIVSASDYPPFSLLANFAFLFVLGLCCVLLLLVLYAMVVWIRGERLNYATRIQVYVYLAFLLPLIAVSITTLTMISKSAESDLKNEFLNKSKVLGDKLGAGLDVYLQSDVTLKPEFENQLLSLTKLSNIDASVFSTEGKLIASSQPLIYQNQLVSTLINREAWSRIVEGKESSFIKNDAIGTLNFNTSYASLKSPNTGELIGILSIPFFDSAHSLEKTKISVWTNILVIFMMVFLLFSLVSFFIVNWLTFPLRFIIRTLGKTTFSGKNMPLAWKSSDEIGLMVNEYNRMLENLERSKMELARNQKESAWREIAKQIAHEINNPLTPMKLTLQRMQQAYLSGATENTEKSLQTLLTQVEILNQIASSFSAFARMPSPVLQEVNLAQVLKKVVDLHSNYTSATFQLHSPENILILGDEQLLIRVFSNIVLNALQSVQEGRPVKIEIATKVESGFCLVSIADNGNGIEAELLDKVFLPHFSTKKSGSGIGLAIAKQGIELGGGAIWFESHVGSGSTFYIRLPLNV
ncbi:MAG: HAMP domain-containing sensor histidine kinase [Bacteroidota bacterium]